MFTYPNDYKDSKDELDIKLHELRALNYVIISNRECITENYCIDKIIIKSRKELKNRVILSAGLHGIEGFVGHSCIMTFLTELLPTLNEHTEVVFFHVLNPYGMDNLSRTNENNVDLNRNFTLNNFSSINEGYNLLQELFSPKEMKHKLLMNSRFYANLVSKIRKHGMDHMHDAILKGQNIDSQGIYYSGTSFEKTTQYVIDQATLLLNNIDSVLWLDIHTGYGPRYQMSLINSQYEKATTKKLVESMSYPLILGLGEDDIYDIDGDMIEFIYDLHKQHNYTSDSTILCYEFGTLGEKTSKTIESIKAIIYDNNIRFKESTENMYQYTKTLMNDLFLPHEEKWRVKAYRDFILATKELLEFKKFT